MAARRGQARKSTTIREILRSSDPALRPAYRVLKQAFSEAELIPIADWRSSLRERRNGLWTDLAWHLIVAEQEGRIIGVVTGNYLGNMNVGVVGYLAVADEGKGQRLGPRLRERLRAALDEDAIRVTGRPLGALVGEVKSDNPWLRALARKPEVLALDFPYYQPRLDPDHDVAKYVLYYESFGRTRQTVPVEELRRLLYTIWRRVYRIARPLDRSPFRRMLRSLRGRGAIGRWHPEPPPRRPRSPTS